MALADQSAPERYWVITPPIVLALFVLIAILPWGLPVEARFVMPMLPYVAIHYWTLNNRGLMPAWLVFLCGLVIDFVTRGPLGFWAMIFLIGQMSALWLSGSLGATRTRRWLGFFAVVALLGAVQWLTASIYFVTWVDVWPFATGIVVVACVYPFFSLALLTRSDEKALS
ncbi:MAG: hypothetical protein AAFQ45_11335 [Pseudomonadota bacterium]